MPDISQKVAVVIPAYKFQPSASELISLQVCIRVLNRHSLILAMPEGLTAENYNKYGKDFAVEYFEKKYFEGIRGYNQLLLSGNFYSRFRDFQYILIYQLDAIVFRDELDYWADRDYDFIGAPWIKSAFRIFLNLCIKVSFRQGLAYLLSYAHRNTVGNGGLSLRKVGSFIRGCDQNISLIKKWEANEDYFWAFSARVGGRRLKIPGWKKAAGFSIEEHPEIALRFLPDKTPFGVHGWEKYRKDYWQGRLKELLTGLNTLTPDQPKISVITVTLNCVNEIERTIQSIAGQTYRNIEFIVVDGQSVDGTIDVIKRNSQPVNRLISAPDNGIYDAMNKGLRLATGDYVWFINAGDEIYENDTLEKILQFGTRGDIYYGDTMLAGNPGNEIGLRRLRPPEKLSWKSFQMGQTVSHQAFIVKKELAPEFDLSYSHSADTDWQINCLKRSGSVINTRLILCKYLQGGKSSKTILPSLKERFKIMVKNYGLIRTLFNHLLIAVRFMIQVARLGRI